MLSIRPKPVLRTAKKNEADEETANESPNDGPHAHRADRVNPAPVIREAPEPGVADEAHDDAEAANSARSFCNSTRLL